MADGDLDRAERIRQRRSASKEKAESGAPDEPDTQEKPVKQEKPDKPDKQKKRRRSVKEVYEPVHAFLPPDTKDRLGTAYKRADLLLDEAGHDLDVEKNRHWYPLVIRAGLDAIDDLDADELAEQIRALDEEVDDE